MARKTTISIEESTHERLKDHKPDNLTFDEFLTALADEFGEVNYRIEFSGIED